MRISDWSSDVCSSDLLDFNNLRDPTSTEHYRYADNEVVNAIVARQIGGAGQNPLLVLQICLGHFNTAGGRRIESRSGLQQADDLSTARTRALHDGVDALLGGPAHFDKIGNRNARNRRIFNDWHHGIAMAAQNEGRDILHAYLELVCQEVAETRAIQNACHAHDLVMGQPGKFPQRPYHSVERDRKSTRLNYIHYRPSLI